MVIEAASKYYNQLNNDLKAVKKYIHNNFGVFLTILYLLGRGRSEFCVSLNC